MNTLSTLVMESTRPDGGVAPVEASNSGGTTEENAWRVFRERLRQDSYDSEWATADLPQAVPDIIRMTQRALGACSCTVYLSNGHGHHIYHDGASLHGPMAQTEPQVDTMSRPAARALAERVPLIINTPDDWTALGEADGSSTEDCETRVMCVLIETDGHTMGIIEAARRDDDPPFTERDLDSARVIGAMAGMTIENYRLRHSMEDGYRSTIRALASAIDAKDPYTCGHSQSVAQYALVTGMMLNLAPNEIRTLETAALLHDIGKIGIDDAILRKPRRLTQTEHAIVKDHPVIGAAIVHDIGSLGEVADLILHHHESYDGTGYPHGLKGEDIPLGARIIAVADAFDSMTTDRPYRRGMTINEAMAELHRCRGTQFCPTALDAFALGFMRYYDDLPRRPRVLEHREPVGAGLSRGCYRRP